MSFTDTITERFETAGRTAVENATETNTKIVDTVVEWNEKAVDATVKSSTQASVSVQSSCLARGSVGTVYATAAPVVCIETSRTAAQSSISGAAHHASPDTGWT